MISHLASRLGQAILPPSFPWVPRSVTLVIDDGPSDVTSVLLSRLKQRGHRAVLFVLGANIAGKEDTLIDALRNGFALGNHSFGHPYFSQISVNEARHEIERTDALIDDLHIRAAVRRPAKWFRFPYLDTGEEHFTVLQTLLRDLGYQRPRATGRRLHDEDRERIDWPTTLCTFDWELRPENDFRDLLRQAEPGEVIEFHDKPETVERFSLPLVEELSNRSLRGVVPRPVRGVLR